MSWFVLYASEDDCYSLVRGSDVICEPSVKIGDDVKFVYGSRKKPIDGVVKALGDDHNALEKVMKDLNKKKPKRDASFHSENPRQAKLRCRTVLSGTNKTRSGTSTSKVSPINSSQTTTDANAMTSHESGSSVLGKVLNADIFTDSEPENNNSDVDDNMGHDSAEDQNSDINSPATAEHALCELPGNITDVNDSDTTDEELDSKKLEDILKGAKVSKVKDLMRMIALAKNQSKSNASSSKEKQKAIPHEASSGKGKQKDVSSEASSSTGKQQDNSTEGSSSKGKQKDDSTEGSSSKGKQKDDSTEGSSSKAKQNASLSEAEGLDNRKDPLTDEESDQTDAGKTSKRVSGPRASRGRAQRRVYAKKAFPGTFFNYTADSPDAIKLCPTYDVYVDSKKLREVKRESKTINTIARKLTKEVFTEEAILSCTVSGRPSSAREGVPSQIRPPLDPMGVKAIYEYCKSRAKSKNVHEESFSSIKKSIGDICNEARYTARLIADQGKGSLD